MRITPLDVHEQTFRVTFRGFDPVEVDGFLQRVADELERLTEERDALRAELVAEREARKGLDETLSAVHTMQEGIVQAAREEADLLRHQARLKADRILAEANEELLRLRRELQTVRERRALALGDLAATARALEAWAEEKAAEEAHPPELIADNGEEDGPGGAGGEDEGDSVPAAPDEGAEEDERPEEG